MMIKLTTAITRYCRIEETAKGCEERLGIAPPLIDSIHVDPATIEPHWIKRHGIENAVLGFLAHEMAHQWLEEGYRELVPPEISPPPIQAAQGRQGRGDLE